MLGFQAGSSLRMFQLIFSSHGFSVISNKRKQELSGVLSLVPHLDLRFFPTSSHALFSIQGGPWWCQVEGELCETVGLPRVQATFPVNTAGADWDIIKLIRKPRPAYLPLDFPVDILPQWDIGPIPSFTQTPKRTSETVIGTVAPKKMRPNHAAPQFFWDPGPAGQ